MKQLAIIIPAYKATFLDAALASIAAQTCKDFTLYIGDDCSPYDLEGIVDRYRGKIDLVYQRFDDNLGGRDLIAQWERCIDMTQGEPWLWLFSDDDVMEPRCVEEFYKAKEAYPEEQLFHFDVEQIDENGNKTKTLKAFPQRLSAYDYLDGKFHGGLVSFVVEFVFRRELFFSNGRFEKFDMAWGSDMITWIKFADAAGGIFTIEGAKVYWRSSGENISPKKSSDVLMRKLCAEIEYMCWIKEFLERKGRKFSYRLYRFVFGEIWRNRKLLSFKNGVSLSHEYNRKAKLPLPTVTFMALWCIVKIGRNK